jgi:hypothetical protein
MSPQQNPSWKGIIDLCHSHSVCPSKLLYKSVTIVVSPKTNMTNFKQLYPIYQIYNFNTS